MWALVTNGIVVELTGVDPAGRFHPSLIWAPCDATVKQGYSATLSGSTWTFAAPPAPPAPSPALLASYALGAGLAITSTGTPALNGTYACDAATQSHLMAELLAVQLSGGTKFADGSTTVAWPDVSGAIHSFTPTAFTAFALAIGAYVAGCYKVINGTASTVPSATATIA